MVWVCYGETISHRRSTAPIVSIFFCFHFRWRLSSYFPCVNSLPYNWRYSKRKWPNEKALMFLSHRVSFLQISRNGIRTGENANSRISSFTSTPSGDIFILEVLRFIHTDDSDEKIVLFLVVANQRRERRNFTSEKSSFAASDWTNDVFH